ncbi:hypothetical protein FIU94_11625 [Sulfitobacter sp. THAF37]|uniref:hypothetical protein n=1 Tax=Sulfitobacter sp. THAF37 TaxID=2587855 RepID=UPI001267C6BA|nr:hypothetical protein [Sulfitobacter sp. THAF37]QFT59474.1 hypothetical protein FIU94_11625 [Sulfitobacter sp. THAF37]
MGNAANEIAFANRIDRIEKQARRTVQARKPRRTRSLGSSLITPLMLCFFMAGGTVYAWEAMDRPTETPLDMAGILSSKVKMLSY